MNQGLRRAAVAQRRPAEPAAVASSDVDVVLISMPFAPVFYPSIGLGMLKSSLTAHGIRSEVRYFTLTYADAIGVKLYRRIGASPQPTITDLAGEWIFAGELFPETAADRDAYIEGVLRSTGSAYRRRRAVSRSMCDHIVRLRRGAGAFLDRCAEEVLSRRPRVIGFTSVFQQHGASLALARRLKLERPEVRIVFGGANCEGAMGRETVRQFPFVDAAVSGEGEGVIPELVRRARDGAGFDGLTGVFTAAGADADSPANAPLVRDLDALPYPDYGDFGEQFAASRLARRWRPSILFESSRGCWWGERSHCTFCGLNGGTMLYRSKSATRVLDELDHLARRFPGSSVVVVDNILDMRYFRDLVPALAERKLGLNLFYETKANLKKPQVRQLRAAGIKTIQPGIESLSDEVLQIMGKGVSALQNVQLLKWCEELAVEPLWNILWGFPGEPPTAYAALAGMIPLLTHLRPPGFVGRIRLDRFSPNFQNAGDIGLVDIRPYPAYRCVYPLPPEAVANLAYYFTFDYRRAQDVEGYTKLLRRRVREWQRDHERSSLFWVDRGERLWVWDLRPAALRPLHVLEGQARRVYLACDEARTPERLALDGDDPAEVLRTLEPLVRSGLMLRLGTKHLSLAVPLGDFAPGPAATDAFFEAAARLARVTRGGSLAVAPPVDAAPPNGRRGGAQRAVRAVGAPGSVAPGRAKLLRPSTFGVNRRGELTIRRGRTVG